MCKSLKVYLLLIFVAILLIMLACTIFSTPTAESPTTQTATDIPLPIEEYPLETLPPPLENVIFPNQDVNYPSDWPPEFRYPHQYITVELSSGSFPESDSFALSAKLKFDGEPEIAADGLMSFFTQIGWEIDEYVELDSGGVLIELTKKSGSSGIIIIDKDYNFANNSNIIAFIIP